MYVHIHIFHVDFPNHIQLCSWEVSAYGSVWSVGGNGHRLGVPGNLLLDSVLQGDMEEKGAGVEKFRFFISEKFVETWYYMGSFSGRCSIYE